MRVTILLFCCWCSWPAGERPGRSGRGSGRRGSTTPTWTSATTPACRSTRKDDCEPQAWHPDQLDLPENLCRPHPIDHGLRVSVSQLRITQ